MRANNNFFLSQFLTDFDEFFSEALPNHPNLLIRGYIFLIDHQKNFIPLLMVQNALNWKKISTSG